MWYTITALNFVNVSTSTHLNLTNDNLLGYLENHQTIPLTDNKPDSYRSCHGQEEACLTQSRKHGQLDIRYLCCAKIKSECSTMHPFLCLWCPLVVIIIRISCSNMIGWGQHARYLQHSAPDTLITVSHALIKTQTQHMTWHPHCVECDLILSWK